MFSKYFCLWEKQLIPLWMPMQILGQLMGKLHGLILVTSSVAPVDLVAALLHCGARCVICKDAATSEPLAMAAVSFFQSFYSHLFTGATILSALASAGELLDCCMYLHIFNNDFAL